MSNANSNLRPCRIRKAPERYQGGDTVSTPSSKGGVSIDQSKRGKLTIDPLKPCGYASRLSEYHDYGKCGVREKPDSAEQFKNKISQLASLIKEVQLVVNR